MHIHTNVIKISAVTPLMVTILGIAQPNQLQLTGLLWADQLLRISCSFLSMANMKILPDLFTNGNYQLMVLPMQTNPLAGLQPVIWKLFRQHLINMVIMPVPTPISMEVRKTENCLRALTGTLTRVINLPFVITTPKMWPIYQLMLLQQQLREWLQDVFRKMQCRFATTTIRWITL